MRKLLKKDSVENIGTVVLPIFKQVVSDEESDNDTISEESLNEDVASSYENDVDATEKLRESIAAELQLQHEKELEIKEKKFAEEIEVARHEGREEGYKNGVADSETEFNNTLASQNEKLHQLDNLLKEIAEFNYATEEKHNEFLVEVIFESICKIIGEQVISKEQTLNIVEQSINKINENLDVSLYLSPQDFELIGGEIKGIERSSQKITVLSDADIKLGGCLIETDDGVLDARLDTQLNELKQLLIAEKNKLINAN